MFNISIFYKTTLKRTIIILILVTDRLQILLPAACTSKNKISFSSLSHIKLQLELHELIKPIKISIRYQACINLWRCDLVQATKIPECYIKA